MLGHVRTHAAGAGGANLGDAKRERKHEITEREVTVLLADFATVWGEQFPRRAGQDRPAPGRAGSTLALLAPDIVEAILAGRPDAGLMLESLERPLPMSWEEQRRHPALASGARS